MNTSLIFTISFKKLCITPFLFLKKRAPKASACSPWTSCLVFERVVALMFKLLPYKALLNFVNFSFHMDLVALHVWVVSIFFFSRMPSVFQNL